MLHAVQPWLPLLVPEPTAGSPARKGRRRLTVKTQAVADAAERRAARRAFLGLVACWDLSGAEALRLLGESSSGEDERARRLEALLGARRSLLLIAPEPARCVEVLRRPEPALSGSSRLQTMLEGGLPAIERVRAHLAVRARGL